MKPDGGCVTRDHAPAHTPAEDPYAAHRCVNCPHLVYENDVPGGACRWAGMPGGGSGKACDCGNHRLAEVLAIESGEVPGDG